MYLDESIYSRALYEELERAGMAVRRPGVDIPFSQFYKRTALSKDKATMLTKSATPKPENAVTPDDTIKNPSVLEFHDLKDEYPEFDLERMNHEPTECTRAIGLHRYSRLIAGVILV